MKVLAAMAALAITLGINSAGDIWELPDVAPATHFAESSAPVDVAVEAVAEAACVVIPVYHDVVETASGTYDWIYTDASAWVESGDWSAHTVQADVVGNFLVIGFDQAGAYSAEMDLRSIDVSDASEVTVCR
jgi:hypothetical protein